MLTGINITNIALIQKLSIDFSEGLNIMSGETGAGKSIIIDSLNFVLGERADKTLIRHGENFAEVEASFYFGENEKVLDALSEIDVDGEDGVVILRRTLNLSGRSDIKINGRAVTLSMLKSVSALLCDIHGQHEHQSLLKVGTHIDILDSFGESDIRDIKGEFSEVYTEYKEVCAKLSETGNKEAQAREYDMLEYAIKEIDSAELYEGIEEEIVSERTKFQNVEKLITAVGLSSELLSGGDDGKCLDLFRRAYSNLASVEKYDGELTPLLERIESLRIELDDLISTLSDVKDGYEFNSERADEIERKYETLKNLKRKYGSTVAQILEYRDDAQKRKDEIQFNSENVEKLEERKVILEDKLYKLGEKLSQKRKEVAKKLEQSIFSELSELSMGGTQFCVNFEQIPTKEFHLQRLTSNGYDEVEFLISPNKGEPLRPLSKIISGGEMSRFMLALKVIFASLDGIGTLVFDEIDTGISGKVAFEVAKKLYKISRMAQVIAVTHLPQIAGIADTNYLIEKKTEGESTRTYVYALSSEEKLKEVSRLSGGIENSDESYSHAESLIESFKNFKQSL